MYKVQEPLRSDTPSDPQIAKKQLAWTGSTYFAEGLPWSLLHQVASEYLTAIGAPAVKVGYTSLLHGPTLLKVVWSPIVGLVSTLRTWMIATQALMGLVVGALALVAHQIALRTDSASADITMIWSCLLCIGVLSAVHDIACDGYYMEALGPEKQARFSGVRVAAFRAAMLVGSSGLVFLGGAYSWRLAFGLGAGFLGLLSLIHSLFLPRLPLARDKEHSAASHADSKEESRGMSRVVDSYLSFFRQRGVVLIIAFLMTYKMADVLMFSMSKVLLGRELGIGTDLRGVVGLFSTVASIFGAVVGGAWIGKVGLKKSLVTITLLMACTEPLFALLATFAPQLSVFHGDVPSTIETFSFAREGFTLSVVTLVIVVEQVCGGFATAAQMVFIMRRCHVAHKTAHFAFATAIYSAAQMAVGAGSGHVYEAVGSVSYFWIVSAMTVPAVVLSFLVPKD